MQKTRNNCFGSKYVARPFVRRYVFSTRNNCYESLAPYVAIIQNVIQSNTVTVNCTYGINHCNTIFLSFAVFASLCMPFICLDCLKILNIIIANKECSVLLLCLFVF